LETQRGMQIKSGGLDRIAAAGKSSSELAARKLT
jgi:hypothetical protein